MVFLHSIGLDYFLKESVTDPQSQKYDNGIHTIFQQNLSQEGNQIKTSEY